ncbi:MAG: hypothetical protein IPH05_08095 [Flavobacteriales bacterium]|jgi:hypothetical protein|nr:hypothetical protein [Flavobacteriales bacterium]MBK6550552.1 hypothetical protein [Flavobacteriales bacterium]MBK6882891.1 hypothetical protein [Flavobacteriales bacterium]MBK7101878.1 hypothetical protein [Flavobacteriales bacterium]MBK7114228.1 hypothetical protein [Flavobacteriales bacterium]
MSVIEASFSGTLRTIGILVLIWLVLRWVLRVQQARKPTTTRTNDQRPPGDVRIENVPPTSSGEPRGNVTDADFEEIK